MPAENAISQLNNLRANLLEHNHAGSLIDSAAEEVDLALGYDQMEAEQRRSMLRDAGTIFALDRSYAGLSAMLNKAHAVRDDVERRCLWDGYAGVLTFAVFPDMQRENGHLLGTQDQVNAFLAQEHIFANALEQAYQSRQEAQSSHAVAA